VKRYIVAGLLVWVPILVTVLVLRFLWELIDQSVALIPHNFQPEVLFGFNVPGFGVFVSLLVLLLTGVFAANFLGRKVVDFSEKILGQIPLVRSIYKAVKQSMQVIFSPAGRSFRQVVMIEYPRPGIWSLGFVTNEGDSYFQKMDSPQVRDTLTIFVPTTPNPTSGFLLFLPRQDVHFIDVAVEEALKTIISLGTAMDVGTYPLASEE
jgi:uncharacterized membrane protein